jgi:hypothetical protein
MDAFTHGMFGELQSYEDRAEFESWLDSVEGTAAVEPLDWTDVLQRHNDAADALEMEYAGAARQEEQEEADWNKWESYYAQWE